MNRKKHLFYEKIQCIYNNIAKKDIYKFTELFFIKNGRASWDNRKSYLYKKWINPKDKIINSRMFKSEYEDYPFSRLTVNGRRIFDSANEFISIDIEKFCSKIKSYIYSQVQLDNSKDIEYKYMYVFNINGVIDSSCIDYYEINYNSVISNGVAITVYPPKHKNSLKIDLYSGVYEKQKNKIIMRFENDDDYISVIFNTDLINKHTKYLVGVGIGIADINQKIPIAKKVVLSKELIENSDELYLILNETEILSAKENSYKLEYSDKNFNFSHLEKYIDKIHRLNTLLKKTSNQQIYGSFYKQLAFKEFSAINNIFQKIKEHRPYYVNYRKRVLDILINSYKSEQYKAIYMVMPIYQDDNIFEQLSSKAIELQNELKRLSYIVKIEIIFVLNRCQDSFSYEFENFLSDICQHINIYFVSKKHIENDVNSIDFLFTDRQNFVVTKFLRVSTPVFNFFQDKATIDEHAVMYRKILNRSLSYKDFFEEKYNLCNSISPILKSLMGKWYIYFYGTRKLWIEKVEIHKDSTIVFLNNKIKSRLEIIEKTNQSIILFEDIKTKQLLSVRFDNYRCKVNNAFLIKVVGKKFDTNLEVFTIGIMSRYCIDLENAQYILGDVDDIRFVEDISIQDRLSGYLAEKLYY